MRSNIKLSIIIPTFNSEKVIFNCLKSLNTISNLNIEILFIDSVSSDRTVEIINQFNFTNSKVFVSKDYGIYDALNKGIALVKTDYFMLIHSGDILDNTVKCLNDIITQMKSKNLDFALNNCTIDFANSKRLMTSNNWKSWMLRIGAQPPHPPTVYKTLSTSSIQYDISIPIIADFNYFEQLINANLRYDALGFQLIHMTGGGATSSGLKSFLFVTKQFADYKGWPLAIIFSITRPFIKFYQMF